MTAVAFDHAATGYRPSQAQALAHAAELAYADEAQAREQAAAWGFDRFAFFEADFSPPFAVDHTQAYTMGNDDMIVTAFRGTEPSQILDWLSDGKAPMVDHPSGEGMVHWGFHTALEAVYPRIRETIDEWRTNDQSLWFTGHSLGGALAMLAAARAHFDDPSLLADGVYTFGQPRTCDGDLASAYDHALKGRTFRFVNNNDIVPQVPPGPVYRHVDQKRYFDSDGRLREEEPNLLGGLMDKAKGYTDDITALRPDADGFTDHAMGAYITCVNTAAR